jgi:hypothetical protein
MCWRPSYYRARGRVQPWAVVVLLAIAFTYRRASLHEHDTRPLSPAITADEGRVPHHRFEAMTAACHPLLSLA